MQKREKKEIKLMNLLKYSIVTIMIVSIVSLIGCMGPGVNDYSYKLSDKYKLFHVEFSRIIDDLNETIIDDDIIEIGWDDDFICAKQKKEGNISFWIINQNSQEIYGPLNKEEYIKNKKDLEVSDKIKFKHPEKYRHLEISNIE